MARSEKPENVNSSVTKLYFCTLFDESLKTIKTMPQIINDFRKCRLFPLNPNNVDFTKCVRNTLEAQWTDAVESEIIVLEDHPVIFRNFKTCY